MQVNKNMKKKALKHIKTTIIRGTFLLFLMGNLIIIGAHIYTAHAQSSAKNTSSLTTANQRQADTTTPVPTNTPTPTPTDTPTPIPPTNTPTPPTPTPTQMPTQVPTQVSTQAPTQAPIQPNPTVDAGGIVPTTIATAKSTVKPTATPSMTPTPEDTTPSPTTVAADTTATNPGTAAGSDAGIPIVPIAIGSVALILFIALAGFFMVRKPKSNKSRPAYATAAFQQNQTTPWLNQQDPDATFAVPLVEQQAPVYPSKNANMSLQSMGSAIPMPTGSLKAIKPSSSPTLSPMSALTFTGPQQAVSPTPPMFMGQQSPTSFSTSSPSHSYQPSDLRPLTAALSLDELSFTQKNPVSTSDMSPFPLDSFDLSQVLAPKDEKDSLTWQSPTRKEANPIAFSPLIAPSIQDDPVLETIMRQAQMGLYALPNKTSADDNLLD